PAPSAPYGLQQLLELCQLRLAPNELARASLRLPPHRNTGSARARLRVAHLCLRRESPRRAGLVAISAAAAAHSAGPRRFLNDTTAQRARACEESAERVAAAAWLRAKPAWSASSVGSDLHQGSGQGIDGGDHDGRARRFRHYSRRRPLMAVDVRTTRTEL